MDWQQRRDRHVPVGRQVDGVVELTGVEPPERGRGPHLDLPMPVGECREPGEQPPRRESRNGRYPNHRGIRPELVRADAQTVEHRDGMTRASPARFRRCHAARQAFQQAYSKLPLELRQAPGQGRHGHSQAVSCR